MPVAEVDVTVELVESLIQRQCPHLSGVEVELIAYGWDNFSFRVGEDLVARLPRRALAVSLIGNEARWLPVLAPRLPLPVPVPVFVGEPGEGYPWPWTLVPWIPGQSATNSEGLDLVGCALEIARFLDCLHTPAPPDAPENPFRGVPLLSRDKATRERIDRLDSTIDSGMTLRAWETALATPEFDGAPLWLHGDLHPNNLLTSNGRLTGVIDFGDITAGDPATDLAIGWTMFSADSRSTFRDAYGLGDDDTWERAKGWAISLATAYIADSGDDSTMRAIGVAAMRQVLEDR